MSYNVWVLVKETQSVADSHTAVMAVYATYDQLVDRVKRIAKANSQYKMEQLTNSLWRIGPQEDEGFFGNSPIFLRAEKVLYSP